MIKRITIQLRRPLGADDSGMVAHGCYKFADGVVTLCTEDGTPLKRGRDEQLTTRTVKGARDAPLWSSAVLAGHSERQVAGRLLHQKTASEKRGGDFNRRLDYPDRGIV
jgi:hypothetical protein